MKGETLKGHLDMLLLAVIRREAAHGYAIIEAMNRRSGWKHVLQEGTIYPALHRLERMNLIQSEWSEGDGRRRRVYQLTPLGIEALAEAMREWKEFEAGVNALLEEVAEPCPV